ncbi:hypothetical protein GCM10011613_13370 [Cellvibrio zantedeschiae]|uniref:Uncharacterized protein n=1 Tax=Cellvibrio zantedeschiae TaxID=1237077 RepID=A0ABQ3AWS3_9GAMM|nr:hypothetical protein [Cellvibrio zantedeschiae]GGY70274.1 hypothetical protein GCM10011613_13370 [Cellvibrio zantedeschiae]
MRNLSNILLLYLFLSYSGWAQASDQKPDKTLLRLCAVEIIATNFQSQDSIHSIAIQIKPSIYRFNLMEILAYQFLSLAFIVSLFHLNKNQ